MKEPKNKELETMLTEFQWRKYRAKMAVRWQVVIRKNHLEKKDTNPSPQIYSEITT